MPEEAIDGVSEDGAEFKGSLLHLTPLKDGKVSERDLSCASADDLFFLGYRAFVRRGDWLTILGCRGWWLLPGCGIGVSMGARTL